MKLRDLQRLRVSHLLSNRKAAAVVEFAVVLPVISLLLMGSLEMGRAVMVRHVLEETSRAGCRVAVFENGNRQDVLDIVAASMEAASIANYKVTINPDPPENLQAFEPVTVALSVPYSEVSWLPASKFMADLTVTGVCVMPAEGVGAKDPEKDNPKTKKKKKKKKKTKAKKKKKKNKKKSKKKSKKKKSRKTKR